jgi:hypothetical protein
VSADQPGPPASLPTQLTDAEREALLRAIADLATAFQQLATALMPTFQAMVQQCAHAYAALQAAGYIDPDGKPTHPTDRRAWQSPYGPPSRTR